jgi:hypothetical protein
MRQIPWLPAIFAGVLTMGPAAAQTRQPQPSFTQQRMPFTQQPLPFHQTPWPYVPGKGWVPPGGTATSAFGQPIVGQDPGRTVTGTIITTPATGYGYGGGYWYPGWYPGWGSYGYPGYYYGGPAYSGPGAPLAYGSYLPQYVPQAAPPAGTFYAAPSGAAVRASGTQAAPTQTDNDRSKAALDVQAVMAKRGLRSGTVAAVRDAEVDVKLRIGGEQKTYTYRPEDVFFFRDGGDLTTGAITPKVLRAGDNVLVPDPDQKDQKDQK